MTQSGSWHGEFFLQKCSIERMWDVPAAVLSAQVLNFFTTRKKALMFSLLRFFPTDFIIWPIFKMKARVTAYEVHHETAAQDGFSSSQFPAQKLGSFPLTAKWDANTQLLVAEIELMI